MKLEMAFDWQIGLEAENENKNHGILSLLRLEFDMSFFTLLFTYTC